MKNTNTMLGRPLAKGGLLTNRQAALTARRKELSLWRFMESLKGGEGFTNKWLPVHPVG